MKVRGIRITITGPPGCGKSTLVNMLLHPVLMDEGYRYRIKDGDAEKRGGPPSGHRIDVLVTNDTEEADAHVRGERE